MYNNLESTRIDYMILLAVIAFIFMVAFIIRCVPDLKRMYYKVTKKWRTKNGGLKYICYNPKEGKFYCKNCGKRITRKLYDETEIRNVVCPHCGQRLCRIFWV